MRSGKQSLMYVITTAGFNTSSPCYDMHLDAIKVLEGSVRQDHFFAIIYTIDQGDDFSDFRVWKKANPNYGVSIDEDSLKIAYEETIQSVEKQNKNLCKHLNVWTNASEGWINSMKWEQCKDESLKIEDFAGERCWIGLDLATKVDICAMMFLFRHKDGFATFGKYYLPEDTIRATGNDHYVKWEKAGWITSIPGGSTNFHYVEDDLKAASKMFDIRELAFDPKFANYLLADVLEWSLFPCVEVNQGPAHINAPMMEVEARIVDRKLWHNGDPVLTWMMGNVVRAKGRGTGPVKYHYPTKEKDKNKIDGPVALIMAMSRAMLDDGSGQSAYDGLSVDEMVRRMTC